MTGAEVVRHAEAARELRTSRDVLDYLGLDPTKPATVALFALAQRYGLDPLLRQVEVLPTKQGPRAYISRDGYLALAHRTGELRGIRTLEASEGEHGWRATVEVRTVDGGVFIDSAGAGFDEANIANPSKDKKGVDPERMAIARAERRALKRAFSALPAAEAEPELDAGPLEVVDEPRPMSYPEVVANVRRPYGTRLDGTEVEPELEHGARPAPAVARPTQPARSSSGSHERQRLARLAYNELDGDTRDAFCAAYGITDLGLPWPGEALAALLDEPAP